MKNNKIFNAIILLIGIAAIVLGIMCFASNKGYTVSFETYGGDAYTGIQNAAARTASNIARSNELNALGFGGILVIAGLVMLAFGISGFVGNKANYVSKPAAEVETQAKAPFEVQSALVQSADVAPSDEETSVQ